MNPYEVLGVSENADMETVKKAYKELVKKYHPDKYVNNPLADLASEKLKEINKAYDMIMNGTQSSSGGYSSSTYYNTQGRTNNSGGASFQNVRSMIMQNRLADAERALSALPHTAEWHYLMGLVYVKKGWYTQGVQYIQRAVSMDPNNFEYRSTLNNFSRNTTQYRTTSGGTFGTSTCDCCTKLICADCCCECMGGDLISCC